MPDRLLVVETAARDRYHVLWYGGQLSVEDDTGSEIPRNGGDNDWRLEEITSIRLYPLDDRGSEGPAVLTLTTEASTTIEVTDKWRGTTDAVLVEIEGRLRSVLASREAPRLRLQIGKQDPQIPPQVFRWKVGGTWIVQFGSGDGPWHFTRVGVTELFDGDDFGRSDAPAAFRDGALGIELAKKKPRLGIRELPFDPDDPARTEPTLVVARRITAIGPPHSIAASAETEAWLVERPAPPSFRNFQATRDAHWAFHTEGLPDAWVHQAWNGCVSDPYHYGLRTVRSGRPGSFVTSLEAVAAASSGSPPAGSELGDQPTSEANWSYVFALRLDLEADRHVVGSCTWSGIRPHVPHEAMLVFPGLRVSDEQALRCGVRIAGTRLVLPPDAPARDQPAQVDFEVERAGAMAAAVDVRVRLGATELWFAGQALQSGRVRVGFGRDTHEGSEQSGRAGPAMDLGLTMTVSRFVPGGQDELPGEEYVGESRQIALEGAGSDPFRPRPPILIPESEVDGMSRRGSGAFDLDVTEQTEPGSTQTLELRLRYGRAGRPSMEHRVLVVDPEPLLVARVRLPELSTETADVAFWRSDSGHWSMTGLEDGSVLELPPQGVGEAMERQRAGTATGKRVPDDIPPDDLADYRFTPTTQLTLRASVHDRAFQNVPWNLRAILADWDRETPGAVLRGAFFEILYGLAGQLDDLDGVRLAEIGARLGRTRGAVALTPAQRVARPYDDDAKQLLQRFRAAWQDLALKQRSRISILEPWRPGHPGPLRFEEGLTYRLRKGADLRYPADGTPLGGVPDNPDGLPGGVAWGFESANVYNAVWRNRTATEPELSSVAFSPLGAWAHQRARFDNGRTTIYADTSMGRVHHLTIERIGRIGVLWLPAKHVVVYERTVRRARQFKAYQDEHAHRPVIRKVREFVEILQDSRDYPDFEASPLTRAFIQGVSVGRKIINVNSAWGGDVRDAGWMVPLWNVEESRAMPDIYPRPEIFFRLAAEPGTGSASEPCAIANPERLVFFTNTQEGYDHHTDAWPPEWGVDFVQQLPPDGADSPVAHGDLKADVADAERVSPGLGRFTYGLDPQARPVHLTAERADAGVSARLTNLTFMRTPRDLGESRDAAVGASLAVPDLVENAYEPLVEIVRRGREALHTVQSGSDAAKEIVRKTRERIDHGRADALKQLQLGRAHLAKVADRIELSDPCAAARAAALQLFDRTFSRSFGELMDARRRLLAEIATISVANAQQVRDGIADQVEALPGELSDFVDRQALVREAKRQVRDAGSELRIALETARVGTNAVVDELEKNLRDAAGDAQRAFEAFEKLFESAASPIGTAMMDTVAGLRAAQSWIPAEGLGRLEAEARAVVAFVIDARERVARLPRATLDQLRTAGNAELVLVRAKVDALSAEIVAAVDALEDAVEPGEALGVPFDFSGLADEIRSVSTADVGLLGRRLRELVEETLPADQLHVMYREARDQVAKKAEEACSTLVPGKELRQQFARYLRALDPGHDLEEAIRSAGDSLKKLEEALESKRREIEREADRAIGEVRREINDAIGQIPVRELDRTARALRAWGDPPELPDLTFNRRKLWYLLDERRDVVEIAPSVAWFNNRLGETKDALEGLGIRLPTRHLRERILPDVLERFDISDIFSDFAGMKLDGLFPRIKLPKISNENVKVTHGVDPQAQRAWVDAEIDIPYGEGRVPVFSQGPLELSVVGARFAARARVETEGDLEPRLTQRAALVGDWELRVGGYLIVVLERVALKFRDGRIRFELKPHQVRFPGALQFLSDLIQQLNMEGEGFTVGLLPHPKVGVVTRVDLPLPPMVQGAWGLDSASLHTRFSLELESREIVIRTGASLSRKAAPFNVTVLILGGGGWVTAEAAYRPLSGRLDAEVQVGITASATLGIALGPIVGVVGVRAGVYAAFRTQGASRGLSVAFVLILFGEVCLAGIVTVGVRIMLEARYNSGDGSLVGYGHYSARIKICRFFTLKVSKNIRYVLIRGGSPKREDHQRAAESYHQLLD